MRATRSHGWRRIPRSAHHFGVPSLATGLAAAALIVSVAVTGLWVRGFVTVRMRRVLPLLILMCIAAVGLGVGAVIVGDGSLRLWLAIPALPLPAAFLALELIAAQPNKPIAVAVGEPVIEFSAIGPGGERFELSSMRGRAYLLKFYRGHW